MSPRNCANSVTVCVLSRQGSFDHNGITLPNTDIKHLGKENKRELTKVRSWCYPKIILNFRAWISCAHLGSDWLDVSSISCNDPHLVFIDGETEFLGGTGVHKMKHEPRIILPRH